MTRPNALKVRPMYNLQFLAWIHKLIQRDDLYRTIKEEDQHNQFSAGDPFLVEIKGIVDKFLIIYTEEILNVQK